MQGILKGTSKVMENLCLKRPPLQIFAAQTAGQLILNQYYSPSRTESCYTLLYESLLFKQNRKLLYSALRVITLRAEFSTGGKPSTWFTPRGPVEQTSQTKKLACYAQLPK